MDRPEHSPTTASFTSRAISPKAWCPLSRWIVRWLLFFLICLGLGYSALERYDPRIAAGLSDSAVYYRLVSGEEVQARESRFRVLVPYVAKPFHALAKKFLDPARAVYLALLISNSIFCATTACLLVSIGIHVTANSGVALLAGTLYLLNFAIPNLQLAGMVDAGEACLILAVTASLFGGRWWLLPLWGLLGALAKETFLPLAGVLVLVWWYVEYRKGNNSVSRLLPISAMLIVALATIIVLRSATPGTSVVADMFAKTHAGSGDFSGFAGAMFSRTFWYVFIWLLPLGLVRLNRLPRSWVVASICSALTALVLGVYRDIGGNVARAMFDVIGPILSLSTAILLTGSTVRKQGGLSGRGQLRISMSDSE